VGVDERLSEGLSRIPPADPGGVYERVVEKKIRRRVMRRVQAAALATVVIAGSAGGVYGLAQVFGPMRERTPGSEILPSANGRIAYVVPDGPGIGFAVYTANPDGSDAVRLTQLGAPLTDLDWSSDGTKLAAGRRAAFVIDPSSGEATDITPNGRSAYGVSWSPDGTQLVAADARAGQDEVYVMNADGTGVRVLTHAGDLGWVDWSPDGMRIAFVGPGPEGAYQASDIYVMDADGSNVTNLTNSDTVDLDPNWSPDGSEIAFRSRRDPPAGWTMGDAPDEIYVMAADGSDVRRLTNDTAVDQSPVWSPDGTRIAYTSMEEGETRVYSFTPDGTDRQRLLPGIPATVIAWQPVPVQDTTPGASPTPSAEPTPSETLAAGEDFGLGYPVCDVTAVRGRFGSPDVEGTALVASVVREGRCPELHRADQVLAVDLDGDHVADASLEDLPCDPWCHAWTAPDVDGDGTDEILVQNIQFTVAGLHLYDLVGEPPNIVAMTVTPPGDPETFEAGEQPQLWYGGDAFGADSLECVGVGSERVLVSSTANQDPPESGPWYVHETTFRVSDGVLQVVETRDYATDGYPFERVDGICGARNPYPGG
jgi:TolB protein